VPRGGGSEAPPGDAGPDAALMAPGESIQTAARASP